MSWYGQASGIKLALTTPVANWVPAATTRVVTIPTDAASQNVLGVFRPEYALITLVVTGNNGSASGNITARFKVRGDDAQPWPNNTDSNYDLTGAMSGTTTMRYTKVIDCRGVTALLLYSVQNADATYTCTANIELTFKD